MKNLEENIFKSCLKGKVKFTTSNLVKFLITGIVALSLTACGGGGGGGGSSSSGGGSGTNIIKEEVKVAEGEEHTNNTTIDLTEADQTNGGVAGISGKKGSRIINNATIKIDDKPEGQATVVSETGEDVLQKLKEMGQSFAIYSESGTVINEENGELIIKGDSVHGIFGLYSKITNNGTIKTDGEKSIDVTGISSLGGDVTNKGTIDIVSEDAAGIRVHNNMTVAGIELEKNEGITVTNEGTVKVTGESPKGIEGNGNKVSIINEQNGTIEVTNKVITGEQERVNSYGISIDSDEDNPERSSENSVVNKGNIKMNFASDKFVSDDYFNVYGIGIDSDKSEVTNTGKIEINTTFGEQHIGSTSAGIRAIGDENKVINSGDIVITSKGQGSGQTSYLGLAGIIGNGDVTITNEKNITITAENEISRVSGIEVQNKNGNDEDEKYENKSFVITNNGVINIKAQGNEYNVFGINAELYNTSSNESAAGTITNDGEIALNAGTGIYVNNNENDFSGNYKEVKIDVVNNGSITISGEYSTGIEGRGQGVSVTNGEKGVITLTGDNSVGLIKETSSSQINNGTINISGNGSKGMELIFGKTLAGDFANNGKINITAGTNQAINSVGVLVMGNNGTVEGKNTGKITVTNGFAQFGDSEEDLTNVIENETAKGMYSSGNGASVINDTTGEIEVSGSSFGMMAENSGTATNNGTINLVGEYKSAEYYMTVIGMVGITSGNITNNGSITSEVGDATGMIVLDGTATNGENGKIVLSGRDVEGMTGEGTLINNGLISVKGDGLIIGMDGMDNAVVENYGEIQVQGVQAETNTLEDNEEILDEAVGITISGTGSTATNKASGLITVIGDRAKGMEAQDGATVINEGTIKVNGKDAYGMVAEGEGSTAVNETTGKMYIGKEAQGAMWATNGGTIINKGTIYVDKNNENINSDENYVMIADGSSTIENTGNIQFSDDVKIEISDNSAYIIGTNQNGSYGKISAKNVSLDGNVKVSADIVKGSYKDSYALDNVIAGKTELGNNYEISSTSLLYDASSKIDENGNLDAELSRNDKNIADFTDKKFTQAAGIFDKAINDEKYRETLSDDAKEILEKVFDKTSSEAEIKNAVADIAGNEYANIARQMFDTKDLFKSYDNSIINSLEDYNFNFNFIGAYADVDSKHGIDGYDSKMTGIAGAMKFNDSLYGVIGYGYNDIDYDKDSDGKIETIHAGIYKDMKSSYADLRVGVFGEYNFHETNRKVLDMTAESDFNSYLAGATVEASRKFGDDLYLRPALSLDVTYGKYEDFTEEKANGANLKAESQDYTSVVPALELRAGKVFVMSEVYAGVKYSYELGDMNKDQDMTLKDFNEKFSLENDNMENAQTDIKVGTTINVKNISVNAEIGKEFGKRDREYVKAGFTYTF